MPSEQTGVGFETTPWSLINLARTGTPGERERAREILVCAYWAPVYAYLRRRRLNRDQAADLTQAFFTDVVLVRELFERADEDAGKMRSLMLKSLDRYVIDQARRDKARGAGLNVPLEALEREEALLQKHAELDPDEVFDRRWRMALIDHALERCRQHYERRGKIGHWELFEARVLRPTLADTDPPPLAEIAEEHGFSSAADAAAAVQVVKRRLNAEIGDTY